MRSILAIILVGTSIVAPKFLLAETALGLLQRLKDELGIFVTLGVALALAVFIWGMIQFVYVSGDEGEHERGRRRMVWGVVALFFVVSIWGIVSILQNIFMTGVQNGCQPTKLDILRKTVTECVN